MLRKIPNCISLFLLKVATDQKYLFTFSSICGAVFALLVYNYNASTDSFTNSPVAGQYDWAYERWLYGQGYSSRPLDPDVGRYKDRARNDSSFEYKIGPQTEAFHLYNSVSVHCLVFPSTEETVISVNRKVFSTPIGRGLTRLGSHWSRASQVMLTLAVLCHKEPARRIQRPY